MENGEECQRIKQNRSLSFLSRDSQRFMVKLSVQTCRELHRIGSFEIQKFS